MALPVSGPWGNKADARGPPFGGFFDSQKWREEEKEERRVWGEGQAGTDASRSKEII